jgi:hypothetical protein
MPWRCGVDSGMLPRRTRPSARPHSGALRRGGWKVPLCREKTEQEEHAASRGGEEDPRKGEWRELSECGRSALVLPSIMPLVAIER